MLSRISKTFKKSYRLASFSTIKIEDKTILFPFAFSSSLDLIRRVDSTFQSDRNLSTDILQNKKAINQVKQSYLLLLKFLVKQKGLDVSKTIEKKLQNRITSCVQELNENDLSIEFSDNINLFNTEESELLKLIEASPIGSMRVKNVDIIRENNAFIHQYNLSRKEDILEYTRKAERKEAESKDLPKNKTKQIQEEMIENMEKPEPLTGWRFHVKYVADKLGFPTDERGYDVPKPIEGIKEIRDKLFSRVGSDSYVMVEDYEVISQFGLYVRDKKTDQVYGNYNKDFKSFRHILRVEKVHDIKDAPSVWRDKPYLLTDVDYMLRGNPHALVKNFVGSA